MQTNKILWKEEYAGGSEQAERMLIDGYARQILNIQRHIAQASNKSPDRTLHAKVIAGVMNARFSVSPHLPAELAAGYFQPAASFTATIRFSNASPMHMPDARADMRGAAIRVHIGADEFHDFLMTNYPVSHARDAWQFMEVAKIATGSKRLIPLRFIMKFGLGETIRIIKNVRSGSRAIESIATEQFWSRAPLLWGDAGPVRYTLIPTAAKSGRTANVADVNDLANELGRRAAQGDIRYTLAVQRYVSADKTPIEDGSVEWRESDSPFISVATVTIPAQDLGSNEALADRQQVDKMAFNPWNCPLVFRPLGGLNRARKAVYSASAKGWLGTQAEGSGHNNPIHERPPK
ncbi:catalase [Herbaspirillum frisingense]|uniref:catalase n=1 Tax=Herbaspirillum frisingense TaxID=92645 RepID=UPI0015FFF638|nr:catalase [Herbaspirillum frisingense]QNB06131.1 catalase [Herbaspirillum frisingense]